MATAENIPDIRTMDDMREKLEETLDRMEALEEDEFDSDEYQRLMDQRERYKQMVAILPAIRAAYKDNAILSDREALSFAKKILCRGLQREFTIGQVEGFFNGACLP